MQRRAPYCDALAECWWASWDGVVDAVKSAAYAAVQADVPRRSFRTIGADYEIADVTLFFIAMFRAWLVDFHFFGECTIHQTDASEFVVTKNSLKVL